MLKNFFFSGLHIILLSVIAGFTNFLCICALNNLLSHDSIGTMRHTSLIDCVGVAAFYIGIGYIINTVLQYAFLKKSGFRITFSYAVIVLLFWLIFHLVLSGINFRNPYTWSEMLSLFATGFIFNLTKPGYLQENPDIEHEF